MADSVRAQSHQELRFADAFVGLATWELEDGIWAELVVDDVPVLLTLDELARLHQAIGLAIKLHRLVEPTGEETPCSNCLTRQEST